MRPPAIYRDRAGKLGRVRRRLFDPVELPPDSSYAAVVDSEGLAAIARPVSIVQDDIEGRYIVAQVWAKSCAYQFARFDRPPTSTSCRLGPMRRDAEPCLFRSVRADVLRIDLG